MDKGERGVPQPHTGPTTLVPIAKLITNGNQIKSSTLLFEDRKLRSTTAGTQDSAIYTMACRPSTTNSRVYQIQRH